jgi:hypothetical protein
MKDANRLGRWAEELVGLVEVSDSLKLYRSGMIGELRSELFRLVRDDRESKESRSSAAR